MSTQCMPSPQPPSPRTRGEGRGEGWWKAALTLGVLLVATSCAKGPVYSKPTAAQPLPESFKENDAWKNAQPSDQAMKGVWWESFGDAALNELEAQVNVSNENLK